MENIKGILSNKVTRNAILYTLLILFVYRIGSFVVAPGINPEALLSLQSRTSSDVATLFNFFGGGSLGRMTLFALGVSPYITASIMIQILENELVPSMNEWKHQGVEGQNKRTNYTKYLALVIAFSQALIITFGLSSTTSYGLITDNSFTIDSGIFQFLNNIPTNYFVVALIMTAGTASLMWLADRITEKGIGNGMSVMIMAGILAGIPAALNSNFVAVISAEGAEAYTQFLIWAIIVIITLIVIIMVIYYNLAYRRISINYVRSGSSSVRKNSYLPIKLNPAGVIPVIFAAPFLLILNIILQWVYNNVSLFTNDGTIGTLESILRSFTDSTGSFVYGGGTYYWFLYVIVYVALIVMFSVFYSYVQMNPENMTENLEKQSAYVIGVRPGQDTLDYISSAILKTSFWGGSILALIAILPIVISNVVSLSTSIQLLGTGIIIVVSVLVQTNQALTNKIESKNYRYLIGERK